MLAVRGREPTGSARGSRSPSRSAAAGGRRLLPFAPALVPQAPAQLSAVAAGSQPCRRRRRAAPQPARPEPPQPPAGEAEEAALKLTPADRQRIQIALTALGFDTRGTDGTFGPRSREMITAWQRANKHPATGYLTAAENQALLRAPEPPKPRTASNTETEIAVPSAAAGRRSGRRRRRSSSASIPVRCRARRRAAGPPSLAPDGSRSAARRCASSPVAWSIRCAAALPVSLGVDPRGAISGNLRLYEAGGCAPTPLGERPPGRRHADARPARRRCELPRYLVGPQRSLADEGVRPPACAPTSRRPLPGRDRDDRQLAVGHRQLERADLRRCKRAPSNET